MENEKPIQPVLEKDDDFLEPYYKKPRFSGKFWRQLVMAVAFIAALLFFKKAVLDVSMTSQELLDSMKFLDISSQWIVKEKVTTGDSQGIVVVPEISFRIRNVGKRNLQFVYYIGVFRWSDNGKTIGEAPQLALRQRLRPGSESGVIRMQAPFGYLVNSLNSLVDNPKNWRDALVEVFAHSKNSEMIQLKQLYISRKIAGTDIDIKIK